jgi:hypothetical protein
MSTSVEKKDESAVSGIKDAATSPSSSSLSEGTGINEKKLLRKLDYRLLPPLILLYLLSFLDRSNGV